MGPDQVDAREANRLYWRTDVPVARIADRLDLSRRALYDLVLPFGSGAPCPSCGVELAFANRSARMQGEASCAECGVTAYVAPAANAVDAPSTVMTDGIEPSAGMADDIDRGAAMVDAVDRPATLGDAADRSAEEDRSLAILRGGDRSPDAREADLRHRAAVLGGTAIACVALGTVATLLAMRRG